MMVTTVECATCRRDFDSAIAPSCPFCDCPACGNSGVVNDGRGQDTHLVLCAADCEAARKLERAEHAARTRADVERDMRDWEANEHALPADERFSKGAR